MDVIGNRMWHVYIIERQQGLLYVGMTVNLERRINEHRRINGEIKLLYKEPFPDQFQAAKREKQIIDLLSIKQNVKSPASIGNAGWRFNIEKEKVNNRKVWIKECLFVSSSLRLFETGKIFRNKMSMEFFIYPIIAALF